MTIRSLHIEHYGVIREFDAEALGDGLIAVCGRRSASLADALRMLIHGDLYGTGPQLLSEKSKLCARIEHGAPYEVLIDCFDFQRQIENEREHESFRFRQQVRRADTDAACPEDDPDLLRSLPEEALASDFPGNRTRLYTERLRHYRDAAICDRSAAFAADTRGISATRTFRAYLKDYIRTFAPHPLCTGKDYLLTLDAKGTFRVTRPGVATAPRLTPGEAALFRYLCFLHLAEFWQGFEQIRDPGHTAPPLVIEGLTDRLDEGLLTDALAHTRRLGRQTFLVYSPRCHFLPELKDCQTLNTDPPSL